MPRAPSPRRRPSTATRRCSCPGPSPRWPPVQRAEVQLRVLGDGEPSPWTAPLTVEAGLLEASDWLAVPVTAAFPDEVPERPVRFRRRFEVRDGLVSARLYVTAFGIYDVRCNGEVVGDELLAPGWTSMRHRIRYATHDLTDQLVPGANALGADRGRGLVARPPRLHGREAGPLRRGHRADRAARAGLRGRGTRHRRHRLVVAGRPGAASLRQPLRRRALRRPARGPVMGHGWVRRCGVGAGRRAGERRRTPGGPGRAAGPAHRGHCASGHHPLPRRRGARRLRSGDRRGHAHPGGRPRRDRGPLRHAEVLEHGELGTRPLRIAEATDVFILSGDGVEIYEPAFTSHGFRYVEVSGWPGELQAGGHRGRLLRLGPADHRHLPVLERRLEHAARQRPTGLAGQRRGPADGLPAARRAPRVDGRRPGLRPHGHVPDRLCRLLRLLAAGPRRRAGRVRRRARLRAGHPVAHPRRPGLGRGLVRRRRRRALAPLRALRRRGSPANGSTRA